MSSNRIGPARSAQRHVYERLSKRLDNLTADERVSSNAEIIASLRKAYFADVDELERSGTVKLPQ